MTRKSSAIPAGPLDPAVKTNSTYGFVPLPLPELGILGIGLHFPESCIGDGEPGQPGPVIIDDVTGAVGRANDLQQQKKKRTKTFQYEVKYILCANVSITANFPIIKLVMLN